MSQGRSKFVQSITRDGTPLDAMSDAEFWRRARIAARELEAHVGMPLPLTVAFCDREFERTAARPHPGDPT